MNLNQYYRNKISGFIVINDFLRIAEIDTIKASKLKSPAQARAGLVDSPSYWRIVKLNN